MNIFRTSQIQQEEVDSTHFSGRAQLKRMSGVTASPSINVYWVDFASQARTDWHVHSGQQILFVVTGRCLIQKWGETVQELAAGDMVCIEAATKHWHGSSGSRMSHLAININATTDWMEKVTDTQYQQAKSDVNS